MKSIIFDFDGTLVDSYKIMIECANQLSVKYKYPPIKNSESLKNKSMEQIIKENLKISWYNLPFYVKEIKRLIVKNISQIRINPEMIEVLRNLAKSCSLSIVSSNSEQLIKGVLVRDDIHFFNYIYSDSSIFGKHKVIDKFISKYHINRNEVVYVGDEIRDIESCKKIGIPIIAVTWGFNNKESLKLYEPEFIIDSPYELEHIIENF